MKKIASLLVLSLLGACSSDEGAATATDSANLITFNDFESGGGWVHDPSLIEQGRAHSGQYSIKVDKDHPFSLTYDMPLGKISSHKFKTIRVEAWAFMPSDKATGNIGIQVMTPTNEQVYGDGLRLPDVVKTYNKWVLVSKDFTLPDNINSNQHLKVFLWRADATDDVLLDDVKVSIKN